MKLVIDIPEELYQNVLNGTYCGTLYESLKNGTPIPKGATHGDVLKKMFNTVFPKTIAIFKFDEIYSIVSICFSREWWDEPYDAEHYAKVRKESEAAE